MDGEDGQTPGVEDRVLSTFLNVMDGISGSKKDELIFIIGCTNRPDLIDSAFLRPGKKK